MPLYDWSKCFILGIPEVDRHHKYLIWILNKTYDEFMDNASPTYLAVLIDELVEYSEYHFTTEERSMNIDGYPALEEHKIEHEFFAAKVAGIKRDYSEGKPVLNAELFSFLIQWVKNHILGTDRKYGEWLLMERESLTESCCSSVKQTYADSVFIDAPRYRLAAKMEEAF